MANVVVNTPRSIENPPGNETKGATPQRLTASTVKTTQISVSPIILACGVSPSERPCVTLVRSSMRPKAPVATVATSTSTRRVVTRPTSRQVMTTAMRMITPPMVGVPCLTR